jgi:hypothetical protein
MRRRKHPPPLIDYLNPSMPVIRDYTFADGRRVTEVDPEYERRYREHMMATSPHPGPRSDPTYKLRKKKCPKTSPMTPRSNVR